MDSSYHRMYDFNYVFVIVQTGEVMFEWSRKYWKRINLPSASLMEDGANGIEFWKEFRVAPERVSSIGAGSHYDNTF